MSLVKVAIFISDSYSQYSVLNMSEKDDETKFQIICLCKNIMIADGLWKMGCFGEFFFIYDKMNPVTPDIFPLQESWCFIVR